MPSFTTRVELHYANENDYQVLHQAMANNNFTRTIVGDNGIRYHLPTAEYNKEGNYTREQVLHSAMAAANTTGRTSSILVTESNGRIWDNLTRV